VDAEQEPSRSGAAGEGLGGALKSSCIGDTEVGVAQVVDGLTSCCIGDGSEDKAGDKDAGVA
jgi:hypothetical protein